MGATPGSIRNDKGRISIWRVPNVLLEPRGNYLPESDGWIEFLNKIRVIGGTVIAIGLALYISGPGGLADTSTTKGADGVTVVNIGSGGLLGDRITAAFLTIAIAALAIPVLGIVLTVMAKPGFRWVTLRRMGLPVLNLAVLFAFIGALGLIFQYLGPRFTGAVEKWDSAWAGLVGIVLGSAAAIVALVWMVKAFYLAATGLLRADDAHPLIGPVLSALLAIGFVVPTIVGGGPTGLPGLIQKTVSISGAVIVVGISIWTVARLRRAYPEDFPFRTGPLGAGVVSQAPESTAPDISFGVPRPIRKFAGGVLALVFVVCAGFAGLMYYYQRGDGTPAAAADTAIAGHWRSPAWGDQYVSVQGSTVKVVYTRNDGRVIGTLAHSAVTGWWTQTPSRKPDRDAGAVEFRLSGSGSHRVLLGTWRHGASGKAESWVATWVGDGVPADIRARLATSDGFVPRP